jgi:hypothetical protein
MAIRRGGASRCTQRTTGVSNMLKDLGKASVETKGHVFGPFFEGGGPPFDKFCGDNTCPDVVRELDTQPAPASGNGKTA